MVKTQSADTPRSHPRGALPTLAALLLALLAGSCGGGNVPTRGDPTMFFSGQPVNAPGVHLRSGLDTSGYFLQLLVVAEGLEGAYSIAYDLHYPEELLTFAGFAGGVFLSENGRVTTRLSVAETSPGVIHVEHTRVGDVGPAPAQDQFVLEPMQLLEWNAHANGTGSFHWSGNRVLDEDGDELPGMSWGTASVTVQGRA
jgi:hypothetical protein